MRIHSIVVRYLNEVILPAIEEGLQKKEERGKISAVSVTAFVATTPEEMNFARVPDLVLRIHAFLSPRHGFARLG